MIREMEPGQLEVRAEARLTEKRALQITAELWEWLSNGVMRKEAWPMWEKYFPSYNLRNNCPLCEYVSRDGITRKGLRIRYLLNCTKCPLYGRWDGFERCYEEGAPYEQWRNAEDGDIAGRLAARIAELCRERLKELR